MTQDVFETLEKLVQNNAGLRNALGVAHDRAVAVETLTEAATANKLCFTPEIIVTFLSQHYGLPISHESLENLTGGSGMPVGAKREYNPFNDPYWSEVADMPIGVTPGPEGKSGA